MFYVLVHRNNMIAGDKPNMHSARRGLTVQFLKCDCVLLLQLLFVKPAWLCDRVATLVQPRASTAGFSVARIPVLSTWAFAGWGEVDGQVFLCIVAGHPPLCHGGRQSYVRRERLPAAPLCFCFSQWANVSLPRPHSLSSRPLSWKLLVEATRGQACGVGGEGRGGSSSKSHDYRTYSPSWGSNAAGRFLVCSRCDWIQLMCGRCDVQTQRMMFGHQGFLLYKQFYVENGWLFISSSPGDGPFYSVTWNVRFVLLSSKL